MSNVQSGRDQPGAVGRGPSSAMMRACEACRCKKTKCDMARPACGLCLRTGTTCQFPSRRRRPARPLKRRKAHSTASDGSLAWLLNLVGTENITQMSTEPVQVITGRQGLDEVPHRRPCDNILAAEPRQDQTAVGLLTENACTQQEPSMLAQSTVSPVSYDLAMHLIETFFTYIQPWLPAFHKPRFIARCSWELQKGPDAMKGLSPEMRLILYSMFALSARFSTLPLLASIRPLDRDKQFLMAARQAYFELRSLLEPNLTYLQGCILLAFHAYTAELDSRAWILTGVCVRLAYDLGLSEIDDDSFEDRPDRDPVTKEEMRRAWWLVWELDTFGSMVSRRPFAVDRHHFTVRLPIADADWFSENNVQSSPLMTPSSEAWRSLQDSENQDPRAWFLVTNHLLSLLFKRLQRTRKGSKESLTEFEIAFNCLKLSLPASFRILSHPPSFNPENVAICNWIMGTHLMLMTAYSVFASLSTGTTEGLALLSGPNGSSDKSTRIRDVAFSQLVARWPVEYMTAAHPFFVCMLMPTHIETSESSLSAQVGASLEGVEQMAELIMTRLSEKWKLAGEIRAIHQEARGFGSNDGVENALLRRRFAVYFPRTATADPRHDTATTHLLHTMASELPEPPFDYQSYFTSPPQTHGSSDRTEEHYGSGLGGISSGEVGDLELPGFDLTQSVALPDMILGAGQSL